MMKKQKIINRLIPLLSVLAFAGCQPQNPGQPDKLRTMMIKATGEVETLPNLATFHIRLDCLKPTVKSSKECLVSKSNELNRKLLSFGIDKNDILTTSVDMNKNYTWTDSGRIFEGYNSSTILYVTVKDLNKLDEIYTELFENRNLEIGGLSYSHSQLDSLKNEAYLKALKNSKVLADKLLKEIPASKKEILKVGNVEISASLPESVEAKNEYDDVAMEKNVTSQNRSISISKGTVLVNATLYVEYLIK